MTKLTRENFPHVWAVAELLCADQGDLRADDVNLSVEECCLDDDGNRVDPTMVDLVLGALSKEDLETFVNGEADDRAAVMDTMPHGAAEANAVVETMFMIIGG